LKYIHNKSMTNCQNYILFRALVKESVYFINISLWRCLMKTLRINALLLSALVVSTAFAAEQQPVQPGYASRVWTAVSTSPSYVWGKAGEVTAKAGTLLAKAERVANFAKDHSVAVGRIDTAARATGLAAVAGLLGYGAYKAYRYFRPAQEATVVVADEAASSVVAQGASVASSANEVTTEIAAKLLAEGYESPEQYPSLLNNNGVRKKVGLAPRNAVVVAQGAPAAVVVEEAAPGYITRACNATKGAFNRAVAAVTRNPWKTAGAVLTTAAVAGGAYYKKDAIKALFSSKTEAAAPKAPDAAQEGAVSAK
jgi:hypothetical protein